MHHIYPVSKGDQFCPLGFHPQVRWPTRCKRCFRDYKDHGGKRAEADVAASSPSLSDSRVPSDGRSWTSTSNLSSSNGTRSGTPAASDDNSSSSVRNLPKRPSSWTSTPDLDEERSTRSSSAAPDIVVNVPLPRRRHTTTLDLAQVEESITLRRPPLPPQAKEAPEDLVIMRSDSLAERARKMQLKKQSSVERESSREKSLPRAIEKEKSPIPDRPDRVKDSGHHQASFMSSRDVQLLQQMKEAQLKKKPPQKPNAENGHSAGSTSTSTHNTIHNNATGNNQQHDELIERLRRELAETKARAERAERDKSDILLRRLASMDTSTNRTAATEALKLQEKVNELSQQLEEVNILKKGLIMKVKDLEQARQHNSSSGRNGGLVGFGGAGGSRHEDEYAKKLRAAEQLCEELMDENTAMKKDLHNMEQEIDEMHDNFREDQADEYSTVKKELEQTTKNCRILQFKYKKSERKIDQLETEKQALASQVNSDLAKRVKQLEEELRKANESSMQLKVQVENTNKIIGKTAKAPSLGTIGKSTSADGKFLRSSLTRGGSQEDPVQLMRDLQDSMEREADIREQLKFAEEEAENLRKKATRVEDENESLMMQLKKMASRARTRRLSPTPPMRALDVPVDKDEGISDEEDPAELRVLLELNEQESTQLRRKVAELERYNETGRKQISDLQEKLKQAATAAASSSGTAKGKLPTFMSKTLANEKETERRLKEQEKLVSDLQRSLQDKERMVDQLQRSNGKSGTTTTSETETNELRTKVVGLEQDNEKLSNENKRLAVHAAKLARKDSLTNSSENQRHGIELVKVRDELSKAEQQRAQLEEKLKTVLDIPADKLPSRTPKKGTDANTKFQLQKMISDLEQEILEHRAIIIRTGGNQLIKMESEKNALLLDMKESKDQLAAAQSEISKSLKASRDSLDSKMGSIAELKDKLRTSSDQGDGYKKKIKTLEETIIKQQVEIKVSDSNKSQLEVQIKTEKDKHKKLESDLNKQKTECERLENEITDVNNEMRVKKRSFDKTKIDLESEITALKARNAGDAVPTKKLKEMRRELDELQTELDRDKKRYSDLTGKYEQLEEEHLLIKAQLTTEKEHLQASLNNNRNQLSDRDDELRILKKDKFDLNRKLNDTAARLKESEAQCLRMSTLEYEKNRLKLTLEERDQQIAQLKDENEMNSDQCDQMRREIDELKRKLTDFERVNKAQSSLNDHTSGLEQELRRLKQKLDAGEVSSKSEVAATRLRYEHQVKNLHTEMTSIQRQCERFKRDRDSFKQLLEGAQKTITDLKSNNSGRVSRASMNSGDEDDKSKIGQMEKQIGYLEDELCEARLDVSKIKTELVSEKSVAEIKISEMQSRLNEYEEDRLINSGRTKIPGMKTKLELSWQKEREEQQRIVQETSTLARDLRQTLFEVERERDKERLESRRKLDLLKKANEEELDEGRKKVSELQCDLLELRDVHAKLRTSNEKLRRERERYERERENASKRRLELEGDRRVGQLLLTVDELVKIAPELIAGARVTSSTTNHTSTASASSPHLHASSRSSNAGSSGTTHKARSPSPSPASIQLTTVLGRLAEASDEMRRYQRTCEEERDRERSRRSGSGSMRRAASTESETPDMPRHSRIVRSSPSNGSLYRKSLSLDQSMQHPADHPAIWKPDDGSMSSMQSIDSEFGGGMVRDNSMDSRLSGGSTQSDMPRGARKKKPRGLMGKLRSLTKGSSSKGGESEGSMQGSDSDVSIASDYRSSKGNLKGRLSGMFKRSSSSTRDSSERILAPDAASAQQQRPVSVTTLNVSNGQMSSSSADAGAALPPPPTTPRVRRSTSRPPTPTGNTPSMPRRVVRSSAKP